MRVRIFLLVLLCSAVHAQAVIEGFAGAPSDPQTPGFHPMVYHYTDDGKPYQLCFMLYLPQSYAAPASGPAAPSLAPATRPAERFPMLVFMSGLGERGSSPQMMLASGVGRSMRIEDELRDWLPMILVGPQCPADSRYEDDRIGKAITGLIDEISRRYAVDASRRYLTGFSMGGTGCWSVARYARERLAVVAPISPRGFKPEVLGEALSGTGTTCLIVSGEVDPKSEPGSTQMTAALRAKGVDVVHALIPKGDHSLWNWYYNDKRFYEWLLLHRQGEPKPAGRMGEADFVQMAKERSDHNDAFLKHMEEDLQQLAPWWHIDNCALSGDQGLRGLTNGKSNVYATLPYYPEMPCRLFSTTTLPQAGHVALHLVVGRHHKGGWQLTVRVNEKEVLASPIDQKSTPDCWKTIDVDLTPWAGQDVRLQLLQSAISGIRPPAAYWQTVKIETGP